MKPVPLLLLLLSVLLSSHLRPVAGRPRSLPGLLDGSGGPLLQTQHQRVVDQLLLRALHSSISSDTSNNNDLLTNDSILRNNHPFTLRMLPPEEPEEHRRSRDDDNDAEALLRNAVAVQLLKRSQDPPLSIDLTFHLLRNMIQIAKSENQREQALLNRKVLEEVGK